MSEKLYDRLMKVYGSRQAAIEMVDHYAEGSLSEEMTLELQMEAASDPELQVEMASLKETVDLLHSVPAIQFADSTSDRILAKLMARGAVAPLPESTAALWQYHLPIQG